MIYKMKQSSKQQVKVTKSFFASLNHDSDSDDENVKQAVPIVIPKETVKPQAIVPPNIKPAVIDDTPQNPWKSQTKFSNSSSNTADTKPKYNSNYNQPKAGGGGYNNQSKGGSYNNQSRGGNSYNNSAPRDDLSKYQTKLNRNISVLDINDADTQAIYHYIKYLMGKSLGPERLVQMVYNIGSNRLNSILALGQLFFVAIKLGPDGFMIAQAVMNAKPELTQDEQYFIVNAKQINKKDKTIYTPIFKAVYNQADTIIKLMIGWGADVYAINVYGNGQTENIFQSLHGGMLAKCEKYPGTKLMTINKYEEILAYLKARIARLEAAKLQSKEEEVVVEDEVKAPTIDSNTKAKTIIDIKCNIGDQFKELLVEAIGKDNDKMIVALISEVNDFMKNKLVDSKIISNIASELDLSADFPDEFVLLNI